MGFVLIYKEFSLTHIPHFSFHFSRKRKRKGDKKLGFQKWGNFKPQEL